MRTISEDLDDLIQKCLRKLKSKEFVLSIYFGQNVAKQYEKLSRQLYNLFQAPLIRAHFIFNKQWILQNITPVPVNEIPERHKTLVEQFAAAYFSKKRIHSAKIPIASYDLAILYNPEDPLSPSNKRAIVKFIRAAESQGMRTEIITKDDYSRIAEFDALFIRDNTAVNHYTYRFSRTALAEGLAVIDDPWSILLCTNKVYLAELLMKAKIPIPKTLIVHKDNREIIEKELGLPCVLKRPDSSFSQGVVKVNDKAILRQEVDRLMESSDLVIAQEYTPSEFDWRIGIIDKKPIFACKYFMAKNHWQIVNWQGEEGSMYGENATLPIEEVPKNILRLAVRAANLIGDGLYGVDLKQIGKKVFVIEINDNPSIEYGAEDIIAKDQLYLTIMKSLRDRIDRIRKAKEITI